MSDYGISVVFGRPFSTAFQKWSDKHIVGRVVESFQTACLHATVVNCTRPKARSEHTPEPVLAQVALLREIWLKRLIPILAESRPFHLVFQLPVLAGQAAILPSKPHPNIGDLIVRLQGGRAWIDQEEVSDLLAQRLAVGANKFATDRRSRTESVSVTLGRAHGQDPMALRSPPAPPEEEIGGLRLAYYRDRRLVDAVISNELRFEAPVEELRREIEGFCSSMK